MFIGHTVQFLILGFHKISCQFFFFFPLYSSREDGHWPAIDLSQQGNLVQVYIQVFKHTSGHCTPPTHTHTTTTHFLMQGLIPPQAGDAFSTF